MMFTHKNTAQQSTVIQKSMRLRTQSASINIITLISNILINKKNKNRMVRRRQVDLNLFSLILKKK